MQVRGVICIFEFPTLQHRRTEASEISRQRRAMVRHDSVLLLGWRAIRPIVAVPISLAFIERQMRNAADGLRSRQRREVAPQFLQKVRDGVDRSVSLAG